MSDSVKMIAQRLVRTRKALGMGGRGGQSKFCDQIKVEKNILIMDLTPQTPNASVSSRLEEHGHDDRP